MPVASEPVWWYLVVSATAIVHQTSATTAAIAAEAIQSDELFRVYYSFFIMDEEIVEEEGLG
mgnify:CR=1 FL=1